MCVWCTWESSSCATSAITRNDVLSHVFFFRVSLSFCVTLSFLRKLTSQIFISLWIWFDDIESTPNVFQGNTSNLLREHMAAKHMEAFACPHCDYSAVTIRWLKEHIKNKHPGMTILWQPRDIYFCYFNTT